MPYKDKEKQREAQRRYEKKKRGKGKLHAIWWGYLYLDSAPDDWETRIRESGYECVWAMHDKDVRPTGEIKRPMCTLPFVSLMRSMSQPPKSY